ncbi:MAG: 4Fe-4S binding protein [Gammaproteobacteria bacterium]
MSQKTSAKRSDSDQEVQQSLYAKREKIYAREVHGLFAWLRLSAVAVLLGLYYGSPWLQWDERQAILFDLPERKFHILGLTFWPQDFFYLAMLLAVSAFALFFFTALAGRLWCGYACPQTVWTEIFMWFERKIEGDRPRQMKLDKMPWNAEKIRVKGSKHLVWIVFAWWTGFTFVGYFTPIRELSANLIAFNLGPGNGSGCFSTDSRPGVMPVSCASRCARTCAPTPVSSPRCSTRTP